MPEVRLCAVTEVPMQGARGMTLELDSYIVFRVGDEMRVYLNRCPHTGINLEWQADDFFSPDGHFLICATHGALFRPEDGYCVRGPCIGDALQRIPVCIRDETLFIVV